MVLESECMNAFLILIHQKAFWSNKSAMQECFAIGFIYMAMCVFLNVLLWLPHFFLSLSHDQNRKILIYRSWFSFYTLKQLKLIALYKKEFIMAIQLHYFTLEWLLF